MARVIDVIGDFKIMKTRRDFVVVNTTLYYKNHSHFSTEENARKCIDFIMDGELPKSKKMRIAIIRLITVAGTKGMKVVEPKPKYNDKHCYRR